MLNGISVDVEEYFHAENLRPFLPPSEKCGLAATRLDYGVNKTLELFSRNNITATFFILGSLARRMPQLVKIITAAGHEIASHGYTHRAVYDQTPEQFFTEITESKKLLEDISGYQVFGYRAPNFSIQDHTTWAYQKLAAAGYLYDSSLYPIAHHRYYNSHRSTTPEKLTFPDGELYILPLAVLPCQLLKLNLRLPLAGGAYWRLLPKTYNSWGLNRINHQQNRWFISYFHTWELDPEQPVIKGLSFLTKLRHYGGINRFEQTVEHFLRNFSFGPICEAGKQSFGENFLNRVGNV